MVRCVHPESPSLEAWWRGAHDRSNDFKMRFHASTIALVALFGPDLIRAGSEDKKAAPKAAPCTLHSPNTGSYFDMTSISLIPPTAGSKPHKDQRIDSWHARGYDYPTNFTLNICAPVLEDLHDVVGIERHRWANVSAYYVWKGKTYSIG